MSTILIVYLPVNACGHQLVHALLFELPQSRCSQSSGSHSHTQTHWQQAQLMIALPETKPQHGHMFTGRHRDSGRQPGCQRWKRWKGQEQRQRAGATSVTVGEVADMLCTHQFVYELAWGAANDGEQMDSGSLVSG